MKKGMSTGNNSESCYLTDTPPTPLISVNASLPQDGIAYVVNWWRLGEGVGVICCRVANQTPSVRKGSSDGRTTQQLPL
jgi:hypothetical protein